MKQKLFKILVLIMLSFPLLAFGPQQKKPDVNDNGKVEITERDYNNSNIEMADAWRENGKIYVVVATISAILLGIVFYLVILDRKVKKMENDIQNM